MKLLFDQNVSPWLCRSLSGLFPDSEHVRSAGLRDAADSVIWEYAAQNGFAIVTKDSDFRQRSFVHGHPPKIIWLRVGNCSTKSIEALLRTRALTMGGPYKITRSITRNPDGTWKFTITKNGFSATISPLP